MPRLVNLANFEQFAAINLSSDPGYDPADQTIPNTANIVLNFYNGGGRILACVLHGQYQGSFNGSVAQANAIHTGLSTGAQWTALAAHLAPQLGFSGVTIRDRNQPNQPTISSSNAAVAGTSSGTELPGEVAVVVTKRTAFVGPGHRGRLYMPGWATTALGTGNTVNAAAVTALGNWASIIASVLNGQGYLFGIGHTHRLAYPGHAERPKGFVPITTVQVRDNHWDTQRRRGLK